MTAPIELFLLCEGREEQARAQKVAEGSYRVSLGDRSYRVDAARSGASWSLLIEGQQSESTVIEESSRRGAVSYRINNGLGNYQVEVLEPLAYLTARRGRGQERERSGITKAYMPGRVVSLLAVEGESVVQGQSVLVLEAMKMENEIKAEANGVLTKLHVLSGAAVESGDALFEISPEPADDDAPE